MYNKSLNILPSLVLSFKMLYNMYQMASRATIPEYLPLGDRKFLKCYVALCLQHRAA